MWWSCRLRRDEQPGTVQRQPSRSKTRCFQRTRGSGPIHASTAWPSMASKASPWGGELFFAVLGIVGTAIRRRKSSLRGRLLIAASTTSARIVKSAVSDAADSIEMRRAAGRLSATVAAPRGTLLEVSSTYFQGWKAYVSGRNTPSEIGQQTGLIRFTVPAGKHRVAVRFTRIWPEGSGRDSALSRPFVSCSFSGGGDLRDTPREMRPSARLVNRRPCRAVAGAAVDFSAGVLREKLPLDRA